jgi:hypothetical protein
MEPQDLYVFNFDAVPTSAADQAADIESATLEVWVRGAALESAEVTAREYVMAHGWVIRSREVGVRCTVEQLQRLEPQVALVAARGFRDGVYMAILAEPKREASTPDTQIRFVAPTPTSDREH